MSIYHGKHPVFVSHAKEIEQMAWFLSDLQRRLQAGGRDSGKEYDCLLRVKAKCSDLLLMMAAEDSEIILVSDKDNWWIRNIVGYMHDVVLKDRQNAG